MAQAIIRDELIEELLQGYNSPQDLLGEEGLFKELKKAPASAQKQTDDSRPIGSIPPPGPLSRGRAKSPD